MDYITLEIVLLIEMIVYVGMSFVVMETCWHPQL